MHTTQCRTLLHAAISTYGPRATAAVANHRGGRDGWAGGNRHARDFRPFESVIGGIGVFLFSIPTLTYCTIVYTRKTHEKILFLISKIYISIIFYLSPEKDTVDLFLHIETANYLYILSGTRKTSYPLYTTIPPTIPTSLEPRNAAQLKNNNNPEKCRTSLPWDWTMVK
jgi:hypothetical protein